MRLLAPVRVAIVLGLCLAAATGGGGAAGAEANALRWKMASWFPSTLPQAGTLATTLVTNLERVSGGDVQLKFFEPGALIPPPECFDSVAVGAVEACWSTPGYWFGKEPALTMFAAVPFGPRAAEYWAWMYYGGGEELMDEIYGRHGLKSLLCGTLAPEASGWFRKEIEAVEDLKGLKMRFFGLGALVMEKLGVSTQLIAGGDIFPALERGSIDATEYSTPAIDLRLGFYQVAKHYYLPGWHQQSTLLELLLNRKKWEALSDREKAQFEVVCGDNMRRGLAEGEAMQARALKQLEAEGVSIHRWSPEFLQRFEKAWEEVVADLAAKNPTFRRVWDSYAAFRAEYAAWRGLGYLD